MASTNFILIPVLLSKLISFFLSYRFSSACEYGDKLKLFVPISMLALEDFSDFLVAIFASVEGPWQQEMLE